MVNSVKNTQYYSHEIQQNHKQQLDNLKQDFQYRYMNSVIYDKKVEDFDFIKTIGCGSFGIVFLVRDKTTFAYHAQKAIEKKIVVEKRSIKQLLLEKKILQSANFPFVISLDFCCKDNLYVYFLLPFQSGGEMFSLLKKLGLFSEPLAQFYAAQIVLALEYLHHCSVVHRDVKPENILITSLGYIKLADFGFSKILKTRTWTLCGTPEYLAPEIIMSKGYTYSVDWWSLGVLIYEMSAGYPPFFSSNPMKLYERILDGNFKTPDVMTPCCKSLVKKLLEVDPTKRFGSLKAGVYDIKSHKWFSETNWCALFQHKVIVPYLPVSSNMVNTNNFPVYDDNKLKKSPNCLYETEFEEF